MRMLISFWLLAILLFPVLLFAEDFGSVSILAFEDGKPLSQAEVIIDGSHAYLTDDEGGVKLPLPVGTHLLEILGKDPTGLNLGYFKKQIEIKNSKDTQVIVTFSSGEDDLIDIDTPLEGKRAQTIRSSGTGWLTGTVLSSETSRPIAAARIFVKGTATDARTGQDGRFRVKVPADIELTISVIHPEYASKTLKKILVEKDQEVVQEVSLSPGGVELEEFVILAPNVQGSITSIVQEEKNEISIANFVGSDEMGKKGDSSAAGALKRVTGVTLIDGEKVYVRGLGDRYSNIEMNSLPLPSPNPLKRSVPLDIFPAGVVSSMKVQKSSTADIPASFGGGYIDIRTKDNSRDKYLKVSIGAKGNSNTGKDVNTYTGSESDWLGFDDGYREINADILNISQVKVGERITALTTDNFSREELSRLTQEFVNRNYQVTKEQQPLGYNFGLEGAHFLDLTENQRITIFGFYAYETDATSRTEAYNKYDMQKATGRLYENPSQSGTIDVASKEYVQNAMVNLGYNYREAFSLKYTKLFTHNADDVTLVADGIMGSNNENFTKYYLNWEERTLNVDQLSGTMDYEFFGQETNFRFGVELASAELYQPNNFQYSFRNEGVPFLDNKISNSIANNLQSTDDMLAFYLQNKFHYDLFSPDDFADFGYAMSSKERESQQNKFFLNKQGANSIVNDSDMTGSIESIYDTYVRSDLPYDQRSLVVGQLFKPADYYDAEVDETSLYVNTFSKPTENVEVLLGARYEDFSQVVHQYVEDRNNPDFSLRRLITRVPEELTATGLYPSLGVKYYYTEQDVFDLAVSQTYIVPDLREFSSGEYFHPFEVATIVGNPELVNTDIYNFDFKYGHYFSDVEYVKSGVFYKYLDNPIEDVQLRSSSLPIYSFDNADKATVYGLEFDGRKGLAFISDRLSEFYLAGNLSFIQSEVTLRPEQESIYTSNNRDLQGLSPFVINLTLGYEIKGRSLTLSYNKMGERLRKVGMIDDGDFFPDHYEDPAAILDLVWIEKFRSGLSFKFKIGNILQQETLWTQGGQVTKSFKDPTTFSVGLSYQM